MPTDPRDFVPPKPETERLKANLFEKWAERLAELNRETDRVAEDVRDAAKAWSEYEANREKPEGDAR